jgi:hypothetical protein
MWFKHSSALCRGCREARAGGALAPKRRKASRGAKVQLPEGWLKDCPIGSAPKGMDFIMANHLLLNLVASQGQMTGALQCSKSSLRYRLDKEVKNGRLQELKLWGNDKKQPLLIGYTHAKTMPTIIRCGRLAACALHPVCLACMAAPADSRRSSLALAGPTHSLSS